MWAKGGEGGLELAREVLRLTEEPNRFTMMYEDSLPLKEKIAAGKMNKFFEENCLLQQAFVKENKVSVEAHIKAVAKELGGEIKLVKCVRFEKGEGIEKKVDDFAAEVASMAK